MTRNNLTAIERDELGIKDTLIRCSIGLENPHDLIDDLKNAFSLL